MRKWMSASTTEHFVKRAGNSVKQNRPNSRGKQKSRFQNRSCRGSINNAIIAVAIKHCVNIYNICAEIYESWWEPCGVGAKNEGKREGTEKERPGVTPYGDVVGTDRRLGRPRHLIDTSHSTFTQRRPRFTFSPTLEKCRSNGKLTASSPNFARELLPQVKWNTK